MMILSTRVSLGRWRRPREPLVLNHHPRQKKSIFLHCCTMYYYQGVISQVSCFLNIEFAIKSGPLKMKFPVGFSSTCLKLACRRTNLDFQCYLNGSYLKNTFLLCTKFLVFDNFTHSYNPKLREENTKITVFPILINNYLSVVKNLYTTLTSKS